MHRTRSGWLIKFELAGVAERDLRLFCRGNSLVLEGERRDCFLEEGSRIHSLEICYSAFRRQLLFPRSLEGVGIDWTLRDGMLLVYLRTEEKA